MQEEPTDDALMARTAAGEETAFRLLVLRWESSVLAFLRQMLDSHEEAQDLTQDTFIKVFGQAARYRPEGRFRSWLFRIAGNLARSRLRRRRVLGWVSFDPLRHDHATTEPAADQQLQAKETEAVLVEALARLPQRQRQALSLVRYHGLKYQEVAEAMDTTLASVESLMQRAMRTLRDQLAGKGGTV